MREWLFYADCFRAALHVRECKHAAHKPVVAEAAPALIEWLRGVRELHVELPKDMRPLRDG